jgi:hypothetical protein
MRNTDEKQLFMQDLFLSLGRLLLLLLEYEK